jgi:hypothetical protein
LSALRKVLALSWSDRFLLLEAWINLGAARLALLTIPFKHIAPYLGRQLPPDHPVPDLPTIPPVARRVAWAIDVMSPRTPWESACLAQAVAGKFMLRRRGLSSRLFLGTRRLEAGDLAAHAWLQLGREIILGGGGRPTFTALSSFDERPEPGRPA